MKSISIGLAMLFCLGGVAFAQEKKQQAKKARTISVWEADIKGIGG